MNYIAFWGLSNELGQNTAEKAQQLTNLHPMIYQV